MDDYVSHGDVEAYEGVNRSVLDCTGYWIGVAAAADWAGRDPPTCLPAPPSTCLPACLPAEPTLPALSLPPDPPARLPNCLPALAAETTDADGLPRPRGPKVQKSGLGDRLAARGFNFEITVRVLQWGLGLWLCLWYLRSHLCAHMGATAVMGPGGLGCRRVCVPGCCMPWVLLSGQYWGCI